MSLWAVFKVNEHPIGAVTIRRIEPINPDGDTVCLYHWTVQTDRDGTATGHIHHRFGDGAVALMAAVLTSAANP